MKSKVTSEIVSAVRAIYGEEGTIPLHEPRFDSSEKKAVDDCIVSTFVSSVGVYVNKFEKALAEYTGSKYAIATVNGTSALHVALLVAGVLPGDLVLTQAFTFIATCNAIKYCGAEPVFVDICPDTLGMSSSSLRAWLEANTYRENNVLKCKNTHARISAILPMHTFGHSAKIDEIIGIAQEFDLLVVEDAAESLGSYYNDRHVGTRGALSVTSFNGNKIITTGGGGAILTNDEDLAQLAKHLTTTARVGSKYEFVHDMVGFNYRMPNLNASLGLSQLEKLDVFVKAKRSVAQHYQQIFASSSIDFFSEPKGCVSNYWLNAVLLGDKVERDIVLRELNDEMILARPPWQLMTSLPMFKDSQRGELPVSEDYVDRLLNIPSSVPPLKGA